MGNGSSELERSGQFFLGVLAAVGFSVILAGLAYLLYRLL